MNFNNEKLSSTAERCIKSLGELSWRMFPVVLVCFQLVISLATVSRELLLTPRSTLISGQINKSTWAVKVPCKYPDPPILYILLF